MTILLVCVVIPFLHFYNEEEDGSSNDRLHSAIKYTFCFTSFMFLMLLVGALMHSPGLDPSLIINKIFHLTETTKFQDAMTMILTLITAAGFLNVTFYTASGIFSWPIGLLLGTSSISNRFETVSDMETLLRMRIDALQTKSRLGQLTERERAQLFDAERELRDLEREETALSGYSNSLGYKLRCATRPIQISIGVLFGLLSTVLVVTLILSNIDRVLHGAGPKQGYLLLNPTLFNPIDFICTKAQDLILIGQAPLLLITSFLVVATISGIRNLGLWFLFARIHRVKINQTPPQALLFFCITMMLAALAFNITLYSMSSQYITFGNQNYRAIDINGTAIVKPCTLQDYNDNCVLTRSSILLIRMMSQIWIFGTAFYWLSWVFIAVGSVSFVAYLVRGKRRATHGLMSDDEFED